ncbi:hypothetical protein [Paenibacillus sp. LjRoot56]|uniref:hypothetical protein n=1 Tax=Paenibacillus sp. LjRoot56 TaxID=3342333 RepID=UPI003ECCAE65
MVLSLGYLILLIFLIGCSKTDTNVIKLPSKGLWRLEANIDEKPFGIVVVEVH